MDFRTASLVFASCAVGYLLLRIRRRDHLSVPPGPPTHPLIGNILKLPSDAPWHTLLDYKKEYGDLVYLHGLGNRVLIVNSLPSINELLGKRWSTYSDRPTFTAVGELMGVEQSIGLMRYGDAWREQRKIMHSSLNITAVKQWRAVQQDLAVLLCKDFLDSPRDFMHHIRLTIARITLYVAYGIFAPNMEDPYVKDNEETMTIVGEGMSPGAFLCDIIPILKYSPSWVPFQRRIAKSKIVIHRTVYQPYEDIKKLVAEGTAPPSVTRDLITSENNDPLAVWTVSNIYAAGTETTAGAVQSFVLAMALNPQVQKRAQDEIDKIVGVDRIPTIADMADLPYIRAVMKETLRWHPSVPLSLPRRTAQDDIYNGFFIPKNTMVLPNIWAISRDTTDPEDFSPDRFLNESNRPVDPFEYVFGAGRRVCAGVHLAESSMFALMSCILFTFDIMPLPGKKLAPIFNGRHVSSPESFECTITPRSQSKAALVRQNAANVMMAS
ncbi:cytochrome P450 [Mycena rebaudengoi]|nr:cytochrome P450 [Mycena rebaudengoi]